MFVIIGIVVVFGAVIGGYLMEHGQLLLLFQPAELVIIGGAALGTLFVANPVSTVISVFKGILSTLKPDPHTPAFYLQTLKMLNDLFMQARKGGLVKLEMDVEEPSKSQVFTKYPAFLKDQHALMFVCDTLRMAITGGISNMDLDQMMELDIEVHHHETSEPVHALTTVADALPGLGIVAAVLGIVLTMSAIGGPPEEIGKKVAAALVGTFLGILLCYGVASPLAANMTKQSDASAQYYQCLRVGIISFVKGSPPIMAVEFARRSIPSHVRPSFKQVENACRGGSAAAATAEAA
jgi:chemotaxis protein MotA